MWWYEESASARRPYCILTRDEAIPVLNRILAVPATTTIRRIPSEVPLDETDGMPQACVLTLDNVARIQPGRCVERITRLSEDRMIKVCEAMGHAVACRTGPAQAQFR